MLYSWQLTCALGSAVAFALCVRDAAGRRRILPFTRDWGAHSSRTLRMGKKSRASVRWENGDLSLRAEEVKSLKSALSDLISERAEQLTKLVTESHQIAI
jgi:hypothetical protein